MKTTYSNPAPDDEDDLAAEYAFDYSKAKPNRFAIQDSQSRMMSENRHQSYLTLINHLLNSPNGKAEEIINENLNLVDTGLVQTMIQLSKNLAQQGNDNNATWLHNIASELSEFIINPLEDIPEKVYLDLLLQILAIIRDSKNDSGQLYQLLEKHLDKLNDIFISVLQNWAKLQCRP